jgi:hypothetical protein
MKWKRRGVHESKTRGQTAGKADCCKSPDWVATKGQEPGQYARAGMAGVTGGVQGRVASRQKVPGVRAQSKSLVIVRLLHVTTPPGEFAEKELLGDACTNPFSGANRKISKH